MGVPRKFEEFELVIIRTMFKYGDSFTRIASELRTTQYMIKKELRKMELLR